MNVLVSRPRHGLSLCAGGGGLDLGVMLAEPGFHTRAFVEWEEPSHHAPISRPLWASMIASHGRTVSRRILKGRSRRRILKGRSRRRLNPLFVGWLMGWPVGHALCACSATEFTLWQQHMRGALSQLPMASGPWIWRPRDAAQHPAQMNLFEGLEQ